MFVVSVGGGGREGAAGWFVTGENSYSGARQKQQLRKALKEGLKYKKQNLISSIAIPFFYKTFYQYLGHLEENH